MQKKSQLDTQCHTISLLKICLGLTQLRFLFSLTQENNLLTKNIFLLTTPERSPSRVGKIPTEISLKKNSFILPFGRFLKFNLFSSKRLNELC